VRSEEGRAYFDELVKSAGTPRNSYRGEEAELADFQRHGLFLADAIECPIPNPSDLAEAVGRATPLVLKRIHLSYKPKFIVLLSKELVGLIPALQTAGWGDRLILDDGNPFAGPFLNDPARPAEFAPGFSDRLARALARLP
jgi:hypothetical protein